MVERKKVVLRLPFALFVFLSLLNSLHWVNSVQHLVFGWSCEVTKQCILFRRNQLLPLLFHPPPSDNPFLVPWPSSRLLKRSFFNNIIMNRTFPNKPIIQAYLLFDVLYWKWGWRMRSSFTCFSFFLLPILQIDILSLHLLTPILVTVELKHSLVNGHCLEKSLFICFKSTIMDKYWGVQNNDLYIIHTDRLTQWLKELHIFYLVGFHQAILHEDALPSPILMMWINFSVI